MRNCCCCIDLKLGGQFLCFIELFCCFNFLLFFAPTRVDHVRSIILNLYYLNANAICIYGIHKEKRLFMLPKLILSWISVAGVALAFALLPFFESVVREAIFEALPRHHGWRDASAEANLVIFILWIVLAIAFAIILHFTLGLQNLYELMKKNKSDLLPTTQRVDFIQRSGLKY